MSPRPKPTNGKPTASAVSLGLIRSRRKRGAGRLDTGNSKLKYWTRRPAPSLAC